MNIRRDLLALSLIVATSTTAACKKKAPADQAPPAAGSGSAIAAGSGSAVAGSGSGSAVAAGSGSAVATPPAPTGPRGLAAAGNSPKLAELATKAKGCKLDPAYPKNSCNAEATAFIAAFDPAADLPTIFNLLEDPDAAVRLMAARTLLDKYVMQSAPGRTSGARLLAAASAETDATVAALLGEAILQGDFADAAYADRVGKLLETHPLPAMRAGLAGNLAVQDEARWLPIMFARFAAETDASVKLALIGGLYTAQDATKVCPFLLDAMKDADITVAAEAGYGVVWSNGKCKDHYDAFNAAYKARLAAGKADFNFVLKTAYMAEAKDATDAQKAAFLEASEAIVADTAISGMARAKALETIGKFGGAKAKDVAKKYVGDADSFVADAAKAIK